MTMGLKRWTKSKCLQFCAVYLTEQLILIELLLPKPNNHSRNLHDGISKEMHSSGAPPPPTAQDEGAFSKRTSLDHGPSIWFWMCSRLGCWWGWSFVIMKEASEVLRLLSFLKKVVLPGSGDLHLVLLLPLLMLSKDNVPCCATCQFWSTDKIIGKWQFCCANWRGGGQNWMQIPKELFRVL